MSHDTTTPSQAANEHADNHDPKLHLTIATTAGNYVHPFPPSTTVQEVIDLTVDHFKTKLLTPPYELRKKGSDVALDPAQTLEALGVQDKETLSLVRVTPGGGK